MTHVQQIPLHVQQFQQTVLSLSLLTQQNKFKNRQMSKSPESNQQQSPSKIKKPKRREGKSLPIIHNKFVPLHQIQSRKTYAQMFYLEKQPKLWSYGPSPNKSNSPPKGDSNLPLVKGLTTLDSSRSNQLTDPSISILDKYFQRKHQKRLKDVIKFIEEAAEDRGSSIGLEELSIFQKALKKKSNELSFFSSDKKKNFQNIEALFDSTKVRKPRRSVLVKTKFQSYIDKYKNSEIDDYFMGESLNA